MKFKDIKVGDTVYVKHREMLNGRSHHFYLAMEVDQVNENTFSVIGATFNKDKGHNITLSNKWSIQAFYYGDKDPYNNHKKIIKDEMTDLVIFMGVKRKATLKENRRKVIIDDINKVLKRLKVSYESNLTIERLNKFYKELELIRRGNKKK